MNTGYNPNGSIDPTQFANKPDAADNQFVMVGEDRMIFPSGFDDSSFMPLVIPFNLSLNTHKITNLGPATTTGDAVEFDQVKSLIAGHDWKDSVRAASVANVNISSPGSAIDGVTLISGDRVLLLAQTTASQNGIYVFNGSSSAMTRSSDATSFNSGMTVAVEEGTVNSGFIAILTTINPIVVGTTALSFTTLPKAAYVGTANRVVLTGNQINLDPNILFEDIKLTISSLDGLAITTGSKGYTQINFSGVIVSWTILADQSGSIVIDLKKSTYSGFPTTSSIAGSSLPTLSSAQKATSSTLTGWGTSVTAGDIWEPVVNSASTVTKITLIIKVQRA